MGNTNCKLFNLEIYDLMSGLRSFLCAFLKDVQDSPCLLGEKRRHDGKCYPENKEDDYGDSQP